MKKMKLHIGAASLVAGVFLLSACGGGTGDTGQTGGPRSAKAAKGGFERDGHGPRGGGPPGGGGSDAAVPVEVASVERRSVSSFLETNGVLEAENDVQIVARTGGPVVELVAEEGMYLKKGDVMLRIDPTEPRAQVEIADVSLKDATRAHQRAKAARENEIISQEVYDQALAKLESAEAQLTEAKIRLSYTTVRAPFDGIVVERHVKLAQNVTVNQELFRFSEFDPLLCRIQVPEKELSRLRKGQTAFLNVEAWPEERFESRVLRISPVVDAATGTIRVTLQVRARGKLSPGMFASVFLVTDTHDNAVVIPKRALSVESLTDTVFVASEGQAVRRDLELGYEETDVVEVLSGLKPGERVIVVGQDGLTDGTPVQVLKGPGAAEVPSRRAGELNGVRPLGARPGAAGGDPPPARRRMDFSKLTPEQIEHIRARMRDRGMTEEQIDAAIKRRQQGQP